MIMMAPKRIMVTTTYSLITTRLSQMTTTSILTPSCPKRALPATFPYNSLRRSLKRSMAQIIFITLAKKISMLQT